MHCYFYKIYSKNDFKNLNNQKVNKLFLKIYNFMKILIYLRIIVIYTTYTILSNTNIIRTKFSLNSANHHELSNFNIMGGILILWSAIKVSFLIFRYIWKYIIGLYKNFKLCNPFNLNISLFLNIAWPLVISSLA